MSEQPQQHRTVKVLNYGDEAFSDRYANVRYDVPAGGDSFVPWDAACLWLGDPRQKNLSASQRNRVAEVKRMMSRNGVLDNSFETLSERRPTLRVFTTEGVEIPMIVDAPDGPAVDPFAAPGQGGEQSTDERVYRLEEALSKLASGDTGGLAATLAELGIGDTQGAASTTKARGASKQAAPQVDAPSKPRVSA